MTDGKGQAPDPETDPGPGWFIGTGRRTRGPDRRSGCGRDRHGGHGYASRAAFAAMSVRCWEPSRAMRVTAR
jgi:hypothetical protein